MNQKIQPEKRQTAPPPSNQEAVALPESLKGEESVTAGDRCGWVFSSSIICRHKVLLENCVERGTFTSRMTETERADKEGRERTVKKVPAAQQHRKRELLPPGGCSVRYRQHGRQLPRLSSLTAEVTRKGLSARAFAGRHRVLFQQETRLQQPGPVRF
ncbi:hypothetical protein F2P81_020613 [Scophthalmus maximus]|uniref:Uncharacterized protein n=1 Tax=Scophthalmus maximus TaxID=52904 RepID=A0A6A4SAW4_SCOMX|nr:hypothetical protein F2P81_020613 [Scophthalmus maximus]